MNRYGGDGGDERFWSDILIALKHPDFEDMSTVDALGEIYDRRREQRRQEHRDGLRITNLP